MRMSGDINTYRAPPKSRNPWLRAATGLILGPLAPLAVVSAVLWTAYAAVKGLDALEWTLGWGLLKAALVAIYAVMFTIGAVLLISLWSAGVSSWFAYAATGAAVGVVSTLAYGAWGLKEPVGAAPLIVMTIFGAMTFLSVRAIAGAPRR